MKICSRCKFTKSDEAFGKSEKSKDGLQYHCSECKSELHQIHRDHRMVSIRASKIRRTNSARRYAIEWLLSHPCVDCGCQDVRVLEFDHLHSKEYDVSRMIADGLSLENIRNEISKCQVRCCNCHFIKTQERLGGGWRSKILASVSPLPSKQEKA